jgi:putative endonuclease
MAAPKDDDRKSLGAYGEDLAGAYLRKQKYTIVETNYRCRSGEVDIIAKDGAVLVFIEVKTRRTSTYGPPQLAVTAFKQRQLSKAALTYLAQKKLVNNPARFDVIAVLLHGPNPSIEHIKNAFELAY